MTKLLQSGLFACLRCHNVWDGHAQCNCFPMTSDSNESSEVCVLEVCILKIYEIIILL